MLRRLRRGAVRLADRLGHRARAEPRAVHHDRPAGRAGPRLHPRRHPAHRRTPGEADVPGPADRGQRRARRPRARPAGRHRRPRRRRPHRRHHLPLPRGPDRQADAGRGRARPDAAGVPGAAPRARPDPPAAHPRGRGGRPTTETAANPRAAPRASVPPSASGGPHDQPAPLPGRRSRVHDAAERTPRPARPGATPRARRRARDRSSGSSRVSPRARAAGRPRSLRHRRAPFVLLVVALLVGTTLGLLVLNTAIAVDSLKATQLRRPTPSGPRRCSASSSRWSPAARPSRDRPRRGGGRPGAGRTAGAPGHRARRHRRSCAAPPSPRRRAGAAEGGN